MSASSETPESVVAAYRHAQSLKDWRNCFLCYDPNRRGDFLGMLFCGIGFSDDVELNAIVDKRLGPEWGLLGDEATILELRQNRRISKNLLMYEVIQKQLDDLPGLVDEICRRFDAMGEEAFPKLGDVRDISIQGDRAVGYFRPPPVTQQETDYWAPIHFCKIDGKWYLSAPQPLPISERAGVLQAEAESLWVVLCCSGTTIGTLSNKRYGELRMSVRPFVYQSNDPNVHLARLTKAQAKKLIDYLAVEGFLQQAWEHGKETSPDRAYCGNRYSIQVSTQHLSLSEDLSWGPGMLKRLDGLRRVMDGDAARAMDAILAGLADERTGTT